MQWRRLKTIVPVLLLFAAGLFLRLYALGGGSLHPDGIIYDVCRTDASFLDVLNRWEELVGQTGQLPVFPAITKAFVNGLRLEPTFRNVILPTALWSSLSVLVFFGLGRKAGGTSFGLILTAVTAIHPLYVQMGREAYFYPTSVLGAALSLWALLIALESAGSGRSFPLRFYPLQAAALFFILYSSAGGWPFALLIALVLFGGLLPGWLKTKQLPRDLIPLTLLYLAFGLPLLFAPWGVRALMALSQGESRAYWTEIFATGRAVPILPKLSAEFLRMSWGYGALRTVFSAAVLLSGCAGFLILGRKDRKWLVMGGLLLAALAAGILSLQGAVWGLDIRRIAAVWAPFFMLLAAGLWWPLHVFPGNKGVAAGMAAVWLAAAALWLQAARLVLRMNGHPVPYQRIVQWLDRTFPPGTPVITERFFTAGTWFNVHPATNVSIVSTVPNELPEIQEKTQFREVTRRFFETHPDAVFFQENHLYDRPAVGPWDWPATFFARRETFVDEAAKELCRMGQNYRASDAWSDQAYARTVFYNLPDDIIARARGEGRPSAVFFPRGWKTVQTRDYRLWRICATEAVIEVWNLTDAPQEMSVVIQAVAAGGAKQMVLNGGEKKLFPNGQITVWTMPPMQFAPGRTALVLRDPAPGPAVPLLVESVEARSVRR